MKEFLFLLVLMALLASPSLILGDPEPPPKQEESYQMECVAPLYACISIQKETKEKLMHYPPDKMQSHYQLMKCDVDSDFKQAQGITIKERQFNNKVLDWDLSFGLSHIQNFGTEFIIG